MSPEDQERIINYTEHEGASVVAVMVPTRAMRVLMLKDKKIFRVEQLDPQNWQWRTISTHSGDEEYESLGPAINHGMQMQTKFKELVKLRQHEDKMARIKAANPTAETVQ